MAHTQQVMAVRDVQRITQACDHCRAKRLKCSEIVGNGSCLNCLNYQATCTFSSRKRKYRDLRGQSSYFPIARLSEKSLNAQQFNVLKNYEITREVWPIVATSSSRITFPFSPESEKGGHTVSSRDDTLLPPRSRFFRSGGRQRTTALAKAILELALDKRYSLDSIACFSLSTPSSDSVEGTFNFGDMIAPIVLGQAEDCDSILTSMPNEELVPGPQTINYLITAFFHNVHQLYPILDEPRFRSRASSLQQGIQSDDDLYHMLFKAVLAAGSASINAATHQESDLKALREHIFEQLLSATPIIYSRASLVSVQVAFIIGLYYAQLKRLGSAWFWCGVSIRLFNTFGMQKEDYFSDDPDSQVLKEMFLLSAFIFETHLESLQYRDGLQLKEDKLKAPSSRIEEDHPVFSMRLSLSRLIRRYHSLYHAGTMIPSDFPDKVDSLLCDANHWRNSLPEGHRPGEDIYVPDSAYQHVLLVHLEYHMLLMNFFVGLSAMAEIFPRDINLMSHESIRVRSPYRHIISQARRVLQTLDAIGDSAHMQPSLNSWLHAMHILPPFLMLYRHMGEKAISHSARSNLDLLFSACQHFRRHRTESNKNKALQDRMILMTNEIAAKIKETEPEITISTSMNLGCSTESSNSLTYACSATQSSTFPTAPLNTLLSSTDFSMNKVAYQNVSVPASEATKRFLPQNFDLSLPSFSQDDTAYTGHPNENFTGFGMSNIGIF